MIRRLAAMTVLFVASALMAENAPTRSEWLPGKYSAWSKIKTHSLIVREDGVTELTGAHIELNGIKYAVFTVPLKNSVSELLGIPVEAVVNE